MDMIISEELSDDLHIIIYTLLFKNKDINNI